jgi:RNA recognition motif-containing protein
MNPKIYVENIAPATTEKELREIFSAYGNVAEVNILMEQTDQKPRGFGFVTMVTPEGARAAIQALHGMRIGEHALTVSETGPRAQPAALAKLPLKGAS